MAKIAQIGAKLIQKHGWHHEFAISENQFLHKNSGAATEQQGFI